jgi:hypothetical protein
VGVNFDALVLSPCEDIFAIACTFTQLVSNPGAPPFVARGVFSSNPIDVQMQDETIFGDQQTSLGIRLRDFALPPPGRGDLVEIVDISHPAFGSKYWIGDVDLDGQGGAALLLRIQHPPDGP